MSKFEHNVARDRQSEKALSALGWRVLVIWECETKTDDEIRGILSEIARAPKG